MGKAQKKTGKGRLDKYYKLAKEQGYRARSAFKLIQLNKKYSFLESARCCIDLCAAPGGWLQVAAKYMPINSIIVGVDLVPIRPIPRVSTFAADITTPHCRSLLRGELKDWKADVVLHDGAPNVGSAWVQDAYSQAELVLMSLKLAAEFLIKGGTFITKVFRSADYNNLLWIFNQLFRHVEATKPPSSRNVSAEIFVVCRDFIAPKHLDPKFLDPKYAFREVQTTEPNNGTSSKNVHANVFLPEKNRRKRDGYDEGDYTLFKRLPASEFVRSEEPVALLGTSNQITFDSEEEAQWLDPDLTTAEIKSCCDDLKVLGKREFKSLLKWRGSLRERLGLDERQADVPTESASVVVQPLFQDSDTALMQEVLALQSKQQSQKKREKRKTNEKKARALQRMQLQMTTPMDIGMEQADAALNDGQEDLFNIGQTLRASSSKDQTIPFDPLSGAEDDGASSYGDSNSVSGHSVVSDLDEQLDAMYSDFKSRRAERDAKYRVREGRKQNKFREEAWSGISADIHSDTDSAEEEGGWDAVEAQKARRDEDDVLSESDFEIASVGFAHSEHAGTSHQTPPKTVSSAAHQWFAQDIFTDVMGGEELVADKPSYERVDSRRGRGYDSEELMEVITEDPLWDQNQDNEDVGKQDIVKELGLTTAEAVSMAQALVNRRTTKTQLLNDGFNRHTFRDQMDLPSWFLDDESKHYKSNIPVTKEAIAALRAKQRALDARPIKKVAEAKARKKFKAAQRFAKAAKKAEGINESTDLSERDKALQIQKLMAQGGSKGSLNVKNKPKVKVVVAKGAHRGVKGRPKGVKGKYLMVDARMRKETRAKKRVAKQSKR